LINAARIWTAVAEKSRQRARGRAGLPEASLAAQGAVSRCIAASRLDPEIAVTGWSPDWDRDKGGLTDLTGLHLVPFMPLAALRSRGRCADRRPAAAAGRPSLDH
jgi:hypothetical protein